MVNQPPTYSIGDMVVHRSYGVGHIEGVESKRLNDAEVECFKVKTRNSTYWFPTENIDNPRVHPLASEQLIEEVIDILQSAPGGLDNNPFEWDERIDEVVNDGGLLAISSLVRDLNALKTEKKINRIQDQALSSLKERLLMEWAASAEVDTQSIIPRLRAYLKTSNTYLHDSD